MLLDEKIVGGEFPTCVLCRKPGNEALREKWGCDEELPPERALLELPCWRCDGRDEDCETCGGQSRIAVTRCPWAVVGDDERAAIEAGIIFLEHGVLPCEGDLYDQTMAFHVAWRIVAQVRGEIMDRNRPKV